MNTACSSGRSVAQTKAAARRGSPAATADSPVAMPCSGPWSGRSSTTVTTSVGNGGSNWSALRTTTTGSRPASSSNRTVRPSNVVPPNGSDALSVPMREEWPPASTTAATTSIAGA